MNISDFSSSICLLITSYYDSLDKLGSWGEEGDMCWGDIDYYVVGQATVLFRPLL